jgi:phosphate starvation-inducible PhoH-like protein
MPSNNKKTFKIPQLEQTIKVNCLKLDEKQLSFLEKSLSEDTKVMIIAGPAGTSKTYMSVYSAMRLLSADPKKDLIYIRTVIESADKGMGALPGDLDEKFNPYILPLLDKLEEVLPKNSTLKRDLLDKGRVSALPVNFLRGASWNNKIIVADEAQNFSFKELTTLITRIGENCTLFICGDPMQSDINGKSGFGDLINIFNDDESQQKGIHSFFFNHSDIKRSKILKFIIQKIQNYGR